MQQHGMKKCPSECEVPWISMMNSRFAIRKLRTLHFALMTFALAPTTRTTTPSLLGLTKFCSLLHQGSPYHWGRLMSTCSRTGRSPIQSNFELMACTSSTLQLWNSLPLHRAMSSMYSWNEGLAVVRWSTPTMQAPSMARVGHGQCLCLPAQASCISSETRRTKSASLMKARQPHIMHFQAAKTKLELPSLRRLFVKLQASSMYHPAMPPGSWSKPRRP